MTIHWNNLSFSNNTRNTLNNFSKDIASKSPILPSIVYGITKSVTNPIYNGVRSVEAAFKGIAHIFSSPFTKDFKVSLGVSLAFKSVIALVKAAAQILLLPAAIPYYAFNYSAPTFQIEAE